MAVENNVSIKSNSNLTQTGNTAKPQQYKVNPNGVDKTPDKDTVQLSTAKKVGIGAGIVAAAVGLFFLFRGKKPPTNIVKQTEQAISHEPPKVAESAEKTVKQATEKIAKETEPAVAKEVESQVAKESEPAVAKEVESQVAKETEPTVAKEVESQVAKETEPTVAKEVESQAAKKAEAEAVKQTDAEAPKQINSLQDLREAEAAEEAAREAQIEANHNNGIAENIAKSKALNKQVDAVMSDKDFDKKLEKFLDSKYSYSVPVGRDKKARKLLFETKTSTIRELIDSSIKGEYKEPIGTLYHGSKTRQSYEAVMNDGFSLDACSTNEYVKGVYFTFDKNDAASWAKLYCPSSVVTAEYKGGKVAVLRRNLGGAFDGGDARYGFGIDGSGFYKAMEKFGLKGHTDLQGKNYQLDNSDLGRALWDRIISRRLQALGYDAVYNTGNNSFVVLDPKNIQIIK